MKKEIQEQDVIRLLNDWKKRDASYPTELQDRRRQAFLALGASALTLEAGSAVAGESLTQAGHAAHLPMTLGMKVTLGVLSTVIVGLSTYLGVTLYENRDALRDLFRESTPTVVLVAESPNPPPTPPYITPTFMSFGTPTPTGSVTPTPPAPGTDETYAEATATKPGLHLGQTKTPKPRP